MSTNTIAPDELARLRQRAASQLGHGSGAISVPLNVSTALAVLYDLASSPDTASDALALLHELQVHQVELDLQCDELRDSRVGLESAVRRHAELYDHQPVACFSIDGDTVMRELNLRAARMLGVARQEAYGLTLNGFLAPDSGRMLRERLSCIAPDKAHDTLMLQWAPKAGPGRQVQAYINTDPMGELFLLVLTDADTGQSVAATR